MSCSGTGLNRGSCLAKLRQAIVEETLVALAEIAFAASITVIQADPIFHAAASADIKIFAEQAFIGQILLGAGEGAFFAAGGEFLQRRFQDIAQSPFRPDKKLTGKAIAGVLDNNKTGALPAICANRVFA